MKVLGIDTSTQCGSVGLVDHGNVISETFLNIPVTHSERLLETIDYLLKGARCPLNAIDGWAISLGPGSFTGLRIGISTVKGLAYATRKPVVGVSSLDVLASQISPTPYLICPILDARKGEVYAAFYRYEELNQLKRKSDYQVLSPERLVKNIQEKTLFIGNGVAIYCDYLKQMLPHFALFTNPLFDLPLGSTVARLGRELLIKGESLNIATFVPLYIRPSEAEIKWQQKASINP